ncbi:putative positive regulator of sigma E activity [Thiobacillus denitrificans ATCC 25259]|uniref:Putative positive regulator of sigma E activity n=1 Tax=Thiobacillus denitrificans (strain ATCC 25259 / T1) TaxID=292415 RepID=Q3SH44_THIDA|nr:SoxR reducing system RseC family protein [Thiobacillus denitrificans]AAZ98045.1 putative positive regulator of sigma E activity [Thiobacillus denitrificans ATCC 25259]
MLEQTAEIVKTAPEGVWVRAVEPSGCGSCGGQGCSSRRIAELFQCKPRQFLVDCDLSLSPGDRVIVGIARGTVLRSAIRAYGLALALMLGGALLGQALHPGDAAAVVGLVLGAALGGLFVRNARAPRPAVLRREPSPLLHMKKG